LQQGQGGRMTTQLGSLHPFVGLPTNDGGLADALIRTSQRSTLRNPHPRRRPRASWKRSARCRRARAERPGQGLRTFCS
jgi:hypothetical protein